MSHSLLLDSQHWDPTNRQNDYQVEALNNFNGFIMEGRRLK